MYYVYVLYNTKIFYIGYTINLKRRLKEHSYNKVRSTNNKNYHLVFYEAYKSKFDAKRREKYFKTTKGKRTLRLMLRESIN